MTPQFRAIFTPFLLIFFLLISSASLQADKKDIFVGQLIPYVKPVLFAEDSEKTDFRVLQGRVMKILSIVEKSDRTYGPKPNELITRACEQHPLNGPKRTIVTANVLEEVYEHAKYLGLFDRKGRFDSTIKNGPHVGSRVRFDYIVSPDKAPEFSNEIANIRIVRVESENKNQEKAPGKTDTIHLRKLHAIHQESLQRLALHEQEANHLLDTSHTGPDKGPYYSKWEKAMKAAGEAASQPAQIKVEAQKHASASRSNGEKMSVRIAVSNYTDIPTKVTVHCYMLGRTDIKRTLFKIGQAHKEVVLLPYGEKQLILYSPPFPSKKQLAGELDGLPTKQQRNGKFTAQGWVVRVEHNGDPVAADSSISRLLPYATEDFAKLTALP